MRGLRNLRGLRKAMLKGLSMTLIATMACMPILTFKHRFGLISFMVLLLNYREDGITLYFTMDLV
jgi:hypothetical protein